MDGKTNQGKVKGWVIECEFSEFLSRKQFQFLVVRQGIDEKKILSLELPVILNNCVCIYVRLLAWPKYSPPAI